MRFKDVARVALGIFFLIVPALHCNAQDSCGDSSKLLPIIRGLRVGYINRAGRLVVKPQFDWARDFSEGMARFEINDKFGFIDNSGKIVIKPQFNMAHDFSDGLAAVKIPDGTCGLCGEWVYINRAGEVVIRTRPIVGKSLYISDFSEGLASFKIEDDKTQNFMKILPYGYIDKTGKIVIEPKFGYSEEFHEGLAVVAKDFMRTGWGYINREGGYVIEPRFSEAGDFHEGLAHVRIGNKWGFIDTTGNIVIEPKFDHAWAFSEGCALVKVNNKYGYIAKTGQILIEPNFEWSWHFSEGLAPARVGSKIGYINKAGEFVIRPQFDEVDYDGFSDGVARIFVRYKINYPPGIGYIDRSGKYIWKPTK